MNQGLVKLIRLVGAVYVVEGANNAGTTCCMSIVRS